MLFGQRFRHLVSLGNNCEPAAMLRRTGRYQSHVPFDWLITTTEAVIDILLDSGSQFGLEFEVRNDGKLIKCLRYGVLCQHEFPRGERGEVRFSEIAIKNCRSKLQHKMRKFDEIGRQGRPTLFLRFGPASPLDWDIVRSQAEATEAAQLNRLVGVIAQIYPRLDFRLLVILQAPQTVRPTVPLDPRIDVVSPPPGSGQGWMLADRTWDDIFASIDYAPVDRTSYAEVLYDNM